MWNRSLSSTDLIDYVTEGIITPTVAPPPPDITNSTWNITSGNLAAGFDGLEWNNGTIANITSNLLSFTVTASSATNMSCRLDVEGNYTENINFNSLTKAATTQTTDHVSSNIRIV